MLKRHPEKGLQSARYRESYCPTRVALQKFLFAKLLFHDTVCYIQLWKPMLWVGCLTNLRRMDQVSLFEFGIMGSFDWNFMR